MAQVEAEKNTRKMKEKKKALSETDKKRTTPKKKESTFTGEREKKEEPVVGSIEEEIRDLGARVVGLGDPQAWLQVLEEQAHVAQIKGGRVNITSG